ncbi:hypothetical protein EJ03DRAFT_323812 [Teratosphaeria nubilosa]|uniref:Uncharacterized protein n=1 Tax=Teratosphaeria nubilosa TaxID=161662 RepID=A0A6G1LMC4_9PEZI|nr:hypothetical protein EJ03DRAFT_323812 [Teratosphaeria nubilosa]
MSPVSHGTLKRGRLPLFRKVKQRPLLFPPKQAFDMKLRLYHFSALVALIPTPAAAAECHYIGQDGCNKKPQKPFEWNVRTMLFLYEAIVDYAHISAIIPEIIR